MGDENHSPLHKRKLAKTLKERQAEGGSQKERRKAKFASYKVTSGPRKGLTKNLSDKDPHGPSSKPPTVEKELSEE